MTVIEHAEAWLGFPCAGGSHAVATSNVTSRVYVSCGNTLATLSIGAQAGGLGFNAATIYAAGMTSLTSLDVIDGATLQLVASIAGLDASSPALLAPGIPAPRQIVVNSVTNRIFVVNPQSGSVAVFDGAANAFLGTLATGDAAAWRRPALCSTTCRSRAACHCRRGFCGIASILTARD
jgi:DNA-binding beta-propeller fold protein YncE